MWSEPLRDLLVIGYLGFHESSTMCRTNVYKLLKEDQANSFIKLNFHICTDPYSWQPCKLQRDWKHYAREAPKVTPCLHSHIVLQKIACPRCTSARRFMCPITTSPLQRSPPPSGSKSRESIGSHGACALTNWRRGWHRRWLWHHPREAWSNENFAARSEPPLKILLSNSCILTAQLKDQWTALHKDHDQVK